MLLILKLNLKITLKKIQRSLYRLWVNTLWLIRTRKLVYALCDKNDKWDVHMYSTTDFYYFLLTVSEEILVLPMSVWGEQWPMTDQNLDFSLRMDIKPHIYNLWMDVNLTFTPWMDLKLIPSVIWI